MSIRIDFHIHLGRGEKNCQDPNQRGLTPEWLIEVMEESDVDRAVAFPVLYEDYRAANREIRQYVDRYPDKIIGFGRLKATPDALEIARDALENLRLKGLKIHHGEIKDPEDPLIHAVFRWLDDHPVPVILDCMYDRVNVLAKLVGRYRFPMVLAHMGGVWYTEHIQKAIEVAQQHPHVYLETSSVLHYRMIEEAVRRIGSRRILFGTDGPIIHMKPMIEIINILHVAEEDKANILGLNAARLLGLPENLTV